MKKAGMSLPCSIADRGLLLVHRGLLVHLVGRLLLAVLFLAVFLFAVLLVHLGAAFRLLFHLAAFVLRERGEARGREHRRDQDCYELLHVIPFSGGWYEKDRPQRAQSESINAPA